MKKLLLFLFLSFVAILVNAQTVSVDSVTAEDSASVAKSKALKKQAFQDSIEKVFVSKAIYPLIKTSKWSGVIPVKNIDVKPDIHQRYKLLIEVTTGIKDSLHAKDLNDAIAEVGRLLNIHVAAGIPKENLDVVVIAHGGVLKSFYTNAVYKEKYKVDNPNIALFNEMTAAGVKFIACGQAMSFLSIEKPQLLPWMKVALSAQSVLTDYGLRGYVHKKWKRNNCGNKIEMKPVSLLKPQPAALFSTAVRQGALLLVLLSNAVLSCTSSPEKILANPAAKEDGGWKPVEEASIPNTPTGAAIKYGKELIEHTARLVGPKGNVAALTNGMNCQNCHLKGGRQLFANGFFLVAATYPKFSPRSGENESIERKVNDCMERSLNGKKLDSGSKEMQAMVAYIKWTGSNVQQDAKQAGLSGTKQPALLQRAADPVQGKAAYNAKCLSCHGKNGEGVVSLNDSFYTYPPLWARTVTT